MASIAIISEVSIRLYSLNENCTTQGETGAVLVHSSGHSRAQRPQPTQHITSTWAKQPCWTEMAPRGQTSAQLPQAGLLLNHSISLERIHTSSFYKFIGHNLPSRNCYINTSLKKPVSFDKTQPVPDTKDSFYLAFIQCIRTISSNSIHHA